MPNERTLNLPLSGNEVIEIILQRIETRLRRDCFLHEAATYNGFSYDLALNIKFKDMMLGKETLVWDKHDEPKLDDVGPLDIEKWNIVSNTDVMSKEKFDSGDSPNGTRMEHGLDIPVQVQEGRRTVIRKRRFAKETE